MDSMPNGTNLAPSIPQLAQSGKRILLLRLIRAAQPISRIEISERLKIDRSTVSENVKPLIDQGIIRIGDAGTRGEKRRRLLSFSSKGPLFIGLNLGVRRSQIGVTDLAGRIRDESEFNTPRDPESAVAIAREKIHELIERNATDRPVFVGISVPGMTDSGRKSLLFAPNLGWRDIELATSLGLDRSVSVIVENDSTAAATFEARMKMRDPSNDTMSDFILVRSGTGIGVGFVIGGEIYRGTGIGVGMAGEFGHMTIVAGGKKCVCGNRGCWEQYASAASAASLYLGDMAVRRDGHVPRFIDIVTKAENGETRARRTLEIIGDHLGIGIANVIMGTGIPRVIVSGRLVYGWKFISEPLFAAIKRSVIGKLDGWSVEQGSPAGAAIGGALEIAVEEYLRNL